MKSDINYKAKRVETVITIAVGFVIIGGILSWKYNQLVYWPIFIVVPVIILGLLFPKIGVLITYLWFKITGSLGWVSSKIILTIFYFLIITPYGIIVSLFHNKDLLNKKSKKSLFIERNKLYNPKDLENPW